MGIFSKDDNGKTNLNTGLSDGFWGAITAGIGAVSGTTNHASDAQAAAYNASSTQQTYLMNSQNQQNNKALDILSNFSLFGKTNSDGSKQKPSISPTYLIIIGVILIIIFAVIIKTRK